MAHKSKKVEEKIIKGKAQGMTQQQISDNLAAQGIKISRSEVSRTLKSLGQTGAIAEQEVKDKKIVRAVGKTLARMDLNACKWEDIIDELHENRADLSPKTIRTIKEAHTAFREDLKFIHELQQDLNKSQQIFIDKQQINFNQVDLLEVLRKKLVEYEDAGKIEIKDLALQIETRDWRTAHE